MINLKTNFQAEEETVEVGSEELFNYPFVFMTGHGNVIFSDQEAKNLRKYLTGGGFLHIDDNYGFDQFIRPQMKKVFPELDFVELPVITPSIIKNIISPQACPKYTSTTASAPKVSALYTKAGWYVFIPTSAIWATAGKITALTQAIARKPA
jgi:hypothetical protein